MFTYKKYRCEWVMQVFETDQYGLHQHGLAILFENVHSNREDAYEELERIAPKNEFHLRRVWGSAPNAYHDARVKYREVLVCESIEEN